MTELFKMHLNKAVTMADFLKVCAEYYDFDHAKLGYASKQILIAHIDKVISISGAKPKK